MLPCTSFRYHYDNICEVYILCWFWYIFNNTWTFKKWRSMSLSHPHWKIPRTSAALVWEIPKQLKIFSCFPSKNLILYFSFRFNKVHQQLMRCHKLTRLFLINIQNIVTFEVSLFCILSLENGNIGYLSITTSDPFILVLTP